MTGPTLQATDENDTGSRSTTLLMVDVWIGTPDGAAASRSASVLYTLSFNMLQLYMIHA